MSNLSKRNIIDEFNIFKMRTCDKKLKDIQNFRANPEDTECNNIDWVIRVGDGSNFVNSSKYCKWGFKSRQSCFTYFRSHVKRGDYLWFVVNKKTPHPDFLPSQLIGSAIYKDMQNRQTGPLLEITQSSEELGWVGVDVWDIEINYENLIDITSLHLIPNLKGNVTIRSYFKKEAILSTTCSVDLPSIRFRINNETIPNPIPITSNTEQVITRNTETLPTVRVEQPKEVVEVVEVDVQTGKYHCRSCNCMLNTSYKLQHERTKKHIKNLL